MNVRLPVVCFLCASSLLSAGNVEVWSAAELKSTAESLASDAGAKSIAGKPLGTASLWRRSRSGEAELHKTKTDLIVIEQGSVTLLFGGSIPDGHTTTAGEIRGKSIQNGATRKLAPGDIIRIPAGTPHQFVLEKGQQVAYYAVKLPR